MRIVRRLHNEELHSLYWSPNIVRVIIYRRITLDREGKVGILSKLKKKPLESDF